MSYHGTNKALYSPPSSPTIHGPGKNNSNHVPPTPDTTDTDGHKLMGATPLGSSNARLSGQKRPAPVPSDNSQDQPPNQKRRTTDLYNSSSPISKFDLEDRKKPAVCVDGGSSSVPMNVLTISMEHVLKMLTRVGAMNVDPLFACVVSAQTAMMACLTDLMFRRAADEENKGQITELEANLKAEKKKNSKLNLQISELRKYLENPDQPKQLFKQT